MTERSNNPGDGWRGSLLRHQKEITRQFAVNRGALLVADRAGEGFDLALHPFREISYFESRLPQLAQQKASVNRIRVLVLRAERI